MPYRHVTSVLLALILAIQVGTLAHAAAMDESVPAARPLLQQTQRFLGRLHPMTVHFPVALIITAALLELLLARRRRAPHESAVVCLALGAVSAAGVAYLGWLNAALEAHSRTLARTIEVHRWSGIATAALALIALVLALAARGGRSPGLLTGYRYALFGAAIAVGFAGHVGGTLIYGKDYALLAFDAFRQAARHGGSTPLSPGGEPEVTTDEPRAADGGSTTAPTTIDFTATIAPIFAAHCYECHGPDKREGKLALHLRSAAFAADPELWTILPGRADQSVLVELIELPADDPDFMPQDGEPLSPEQIALIRRWIDEGAPWPDDTGPGPAAPHASSAPPQREPAEMPEDALDLEIAEPPAAQREPIDTAIDFLRKNGVSVTPIRTGSAGLKADFSPAGMDVGDPQIELLLPLDALLVELDLSGTAISDAGLILLRDMGTLRVLRLARTTVGDGGLQHLGAARDLRFLDLSETRVSDQGVGALHTRLPALVIRR